MSKKGMFSYIREILRDYPKIKRKAPESWTQKEKMRVHVVESTLSELSQMQDGARILEIIDMVYIKESHTLYGAALAVHVSRRKAAYWTEEMTRRMVEKIGLI